MRLGNSVQYGSMVFKCCLKILSLSPLMFIFTLCALGGSDAHLQNAHKPKAHHTHCLMLQITVNQNNIYENLSLSGMCVYIYICSGKDKSLCAYRDGVGALQFRPSSPHAFGGGSGTG